ncbi:MAG: PilZ domain-containing protein [Enhygromyxa sp.]
MDERRAHQRFACDLRARVVLPDGHVLEGHAVDISFSGICVHMDEPVAPRKMVEFQIWAVLPERETEAIVVPAKIVWSTRVEGSHQLGAAFDRDMDNRSWMRLDMLLQFLAGTLEQPDRL